MTLATVDDLLAIILIAVFFFIGERMVLVPWHSRMRGRLVLSGPHAQGTVVGRGHRGRAGMGHDVRSRRAPHFGRRARGLLTPAHERFGEKMPRAERYADKLQPFSALLALPIFALFATGVHFESLDLALFVSPVVVAVMVALVVGKPLGIMTTAWLSTHVGGLKDGQGLRVRDMFPAACACGIGFTVSFLIARRWHIRMLNAIG